MGGKHYLLGASDSKDYFSKTFLYRYQQFLKVRLNKYLIMKQDTSKKSKCETIYLS